MKHWIFSLIFFCMFSFAHATVPWIVYGATLVPGNSNLDNPVPSVNGLIGEVHSLPYTVPDGFQLVITTYAIEGGKTPQYAIIPWIGEFPIINSKGLMTCAAAYGSNIYSNMNWTLPQGTKLNVRIANASNDGIAYAFGWYMEGYLRAND